MSEDRHEQAAKLRYPFPDAPAPGEAVEVAQGVLWMRLPLPMALDHVNIYALDDGDGWTIIDTGMRTPEGIKGWAALKAGPLAGKQVTRVVLTHHHPDHVGFVGNFVRDGAELLTSRTAYLTARMLTLDAQASYPPETVTFYRRAGMAEAVLQKRLEERPFNFADVVVPMPLGYTRLRHGDAITMGGRRWAVHEGNGHAPEHLTFWSQDDDLVLAGDQILPSISPNIGVYPTEPEADPVGEWLESCERLAYLAEDRHLVLGGHKLPFTGLPIRMRQLIDNHHGVLDRLLAALDTPKAAGDVFQPIFKREIRGGEYGLALVEAFAHCQHLFHEDRVERTLREDGAFVYRRL
ncbi:MAG: MBL fold metallo-hydrolase [Pseudomonadota bacterium]